jgi:hypothetical protein
MGQFDSRSEAALMQVKIENLSSSPADRLATKLASIGSKVLEFVGFSGASALTDFTLELKGIAADKDESNLIYFGENVVEDIRELYRHCRELKEQLDETVRSDRFGIVMANATLHVPRANDPRCLKLLALIIANSVRTNDLNPVSLDDMMRAAVELREQDLALLQKIYDSQEGIIRRGVRDSTHLYSDVQYAWGEFLKSGTLRGMNQLTYRSSLARLQSHGLVQQISATQFGIGEEPYMLLEEGAGFVKRIKAIGSGQ